MPTLLDDVVLLATGWFCGIACIVSCLRGYANDHEEPATPKIEDGVENNNGKKISV